MDFYGSIDYARQVAHGLAGAAQYEFEQLYGSLPESRDKRFLASLPAWVIERN
jgi:geranylgeranyl diphosphate synthase type II